MCNLLQIKHVGESDELPCQMTLENFTHGQASPPDILIKSLKVFNLLMVLIMDKSQQQLAVKLCQQHTLSLMAGLNHQNIYALQWH